MIQVITGQLDLEAALKKVRARSRGRKAPLCTRWSRSYTAIQAAARIRRVKVGSGREADGVLS
eukprot:6290494-Amphidinium_carterae.1